MDGLDDLLIVLEYIQGHIIGYHMHTAPDGVKDALERLRLRRDNHQPFDLQIPVNLERNNG